jgi:hypothetical protein
MDANQAQIKTSKEMLAKMVANQAEMLARMEAKTDINLKEMNEEIRTNQTKVDANLKEMKEELTARLEAKIEAEIKTNNEKFETIQSTLTSRIDIQDRGHSKRNKSPDKCPSGKNVSQCKYLAKRGEGLRKATESCLEKAKANLEKMKASLEEMETAGDVFKERLNKMDTTDLEAN